MGFFGRVYALVRHIPPGRVATYGQIARLLGQPHAARTVGWAMRDAPPGAGIPWHRVVNAAGRISIPNPGGAAKQRRLLEGEGVVFDAQGRIDLARFQWAGLAWPKVEALLSKKGENDEET